MKFVDDVGYHPGEIEVLQAAGVDTTNYHVANVVDWNPFSDERGIISEANVIGRRQWTEKDPVDGKYVIPWTIQDGYPHEDTLTTYMENLNNNLGRFRIPSSQNTLNENVFGDKVNLNHKSLYQDSQSSTRRFVNDFICQWNHFCLGKFWMLFLSRCLCWLLLRLQLCRFG